MKHYCPTCDVTTEVPPGAPSCGKGCHMRPDILELREPLQNFASLMEQKLRKNDHKTGWRHLPVEALVKLMLLELEEFRVADEFFPVKEARGELVDLANFAMMLHDRLGMLDVDKTRKEQNAVSK